MTSTPEQPDGLLGPAAIRELAQQLELRPTKTLGQNFLHDANTIRRIVRTADLSPDDVVCEVGPGLGSLTLGLLPACAAVTAVEIDPRLADQLPRTVAARLPHLADRLAAGPGTDAYGVPSVKAAWYAGVRRAGNVPRPVFWPVPNVDSGLVALPRRPAPPGDRAATFAVVDAAFATRRKGLRAALARWAGSPAAAEQRLRAAGIDPTTRGEQLSVEDFARLAATEAPA